MPSAILLDVRIDLGVGAFEIGIRDQSRSAVSGADDVHHVEVALANDAVPVDVEKIETGSSAPVAEQARLHVVERERALEQRIVFEIDLSDGEVVGGAPVGVHFCQLIGAQGALGSLFRLDSSTVASHGVPVGSVPQFRLAAVC